MVDVWGADHHGYVPRVKAALTALGDDPQRLDVMAAVGARQGRPPTLDARGWLGAQMLAYPIDGRHDRLAGLDVDHPLDLSGTG